LSDHRYTEAEAQHDGRETYQHVQCLGHSSPLTLGIPKSYRLPGLRTQAKLVSCSSRPPGGENILRNSAATPIYVLTLKADIATGRIYKDSNRNAECHY
jgi:hypothetical protein